MKVHAKDAAGAIVNQRGRKLAESSSSPQTVQAKKTAVGAKPEAAAPPNNRTAKRQPSGSSRGASNSKKLVCRYCGSDDLSPSFKKRRDARCRACFKKRYGSAARGKKASGTRKTRVTKYL